MASKTLLFLLFCPLLFLQLLLSSSAQDVKAAYGYSDSGFEAKNIDSTLFTHLFCAFAHLDSNTNQVTNSSSNNAQFSQFTKTVQLKNPSVKTLLSIGGGSSNATAFAAMASQFTSRKIFIDSSIKLARFYGFHGLDLAWEYPQAASDMTNLGSLLNEWRAEVATEAKNTGQPPLILSAAVSNGSSVDGFNYSIQSIANSLHWINLMAYDFYDPTRSKVTNSHAALFDPIGHASASYGIMAWIQTGMSSKKLVLGLPFHWYAWRLVNGNSHGLMAPASGPVGSDKGDIGYKNIREFIAQNNATTVYNSTIVSDYCYAGTTWIGYDDTQEYLHQGFIC